MSSLLLIPIHLDALPLAEDRIVVEAMADFSRLAYLDGGQEINSDTPNLSEEIVSQPFENENLRLKAGVHLHWSLPDALTKGDHSAEGTTFPSVPNRWLVTRSKMDANGESPVEKQWVVESDYLYPDGEGELTGSVSIPFPADETGGKPRPFRFLGRKVAREVWQDDASAEYLNPLTAVCYGEPAFAAFYPNCHSVFGLYDDEYTNAIPDGLQYDVCGWYSDRAQDAFSKFVADFRASYEGSDGNSTPTSEELLAALEDSFKWTAAIEAGEEFPEQMLCYARLIFNQTGTSTENPALQDADTTVTVADTGTEALSAYLGQTVDSTQKTIIEDQLEALHLSASLESKQLDVGPKFQEARHEKGFTAISGGALWSVAPQTDTATPADAADAQAQITLPEEMAHLLNSLNLLQQAYDRAAQEMESMRKQLFSDWYKYMLCAYPPDDSRDDYPNSDAVRNYVELKSLAPLRRKITETGELLLQNDSAGNVTAASASGSPEVALAPRVAEAVNKLLRSIAQHNNPPGGTPAKTPFALRQINAPRYWQPNEPVVLMTGPAVKATPRHGQDGRLREDGLLECQLLQDAALPGVVLNNLSLVRARIDEIASEVSGESIAFSTWTQQPWNPFLLEWRVEVFPLDISGNVNVESGSYQPDFITSNYTLAENEVDLSAASEMRIAKAANVYSGSTILTDYASDQLRNEIEAYLEKQILADYYTAQSVPPEEQTDTYFDEHTAEILSWYKDSYCINDRDLDAAIRNIISAYEHLTAPDFYSLSQSLGGFNDALLMHRQTLQLTIAEPLGFDDYRTFTNRVRDFVQDDNKSAPEPLNDFNPIRTGTMRILNLRLVDTFGQFKEVDCSNLITAEKMTAPDDPYLVSLPPRLVPPSRVNFRWLSAVQDEQEMNDDPATSPVCGWLLTNNLDSSLMIYDGDGKALGAINQLARWEASPGDNAPLTEDEIPNPHLQRVVKHICSLGAQFVSDFISTLDNALENIEPENFAQHQDLALLMGRPLALVRAFLNLELLGLPAVHQGWNAFRQDMERNTRETNHFEDVGFPIRIGEYRQFNDGLAGYWKEDDENYTEGIFYAPQSVGDDEGGIDNEHIRTHANDPMTIFQSVQSPPQFLTMLIDPRGSVHATSGISPSKSISLPPDQYAPALQAIEITFLSTPVLTELQKIRLPLTDEPGYEWSWIEKEGGGWLETPIAGKVRRQVFSDSFVDAEIVWSRLVEKGWIDVIDTANASVRPQNLRTGPLLGDDLEKFVPDIERLLQSSTTSKGTIEKKLFIETFVGGEVVWNRLVTGGWIDVIDSTTAGVRPKDRRTLPDLGDDMKSIVPAVEIILDASSIGRINLEATFSGQQIIREGWLKLREKGNN